LAKDRIGIGADVVFSEIEMNIEGFKEVQAIGNILCP